MSFQDDEIETLKVHLIQLHEKNSCEIGSIMFDCLKVEINSFLKNEKVFSSKIKNECKTS